MQLSLFIIVYYNNDIIFKTIAADALVPYMTKSSAIVV